MATDIDSLRIKIEETSNDAAEKIDQLSAALSNLKTIAKGGAGLTSVVNQLNKLKEALSGISGNASVLKSVSDTLRSFSGSASGSMSALGSLSRTAKSAKVDYSSLSEEVKSVASSFASLPSNVQSSAISLAKAKTAIDNLSGTKVSVSLDEARDSLEKLKESANTSSSVFAKLKSAFSGTKSTTESVASAYASLPPAIQKAILANAALETSNTKTAKSFGVLGTGISSAKVKFGIYFLMMQRVASLMSNWVLSANNYIESVNLFQTSMGEYYDEALSYANLVNKKLGIDPAVWMDAQGTFKLMADGFGIAKDQAYKLSKSLTELAYDITSLKNKTPQEAVNKLRSALAGELEPIRELGLSISQATLQEYALKKGITESVSSMTEQEKALLRSVKVLEDASRIGYVYDFAKTLESPANAMRVFQQQVTQLGMALGTVLLPIIVQILPWLQAIAEILTEAISAFAVFIGFTMPKWDVEDWSDNISSGASNAADSMGGATSAAKELKKTLLGIDELNLLQKETDSGGGGAGGIGGGMSDWADSLEIPKIWDDEKISEIQTKADKLKATLKEMLIDYVIPIGAGFAAWKIASGVLTGVSTLSQLLKNLPAGMVDFGFNFKVIGLTMFLADLNEFMRYLNDFRENGATFQNVVGMISEFAGMVGDALILLGSLKVGGALKVVQGIGEIAVAIKDISENGVNWNNALTAVRGLTNIAIGIGVFTGNIKLAAWGVAIQGFTTIIKELAENWEAIKRGDWSGVDKAALAIGAIEAIGGIAVALGAFSKLKSLFSGSKATETIQSVTTAVQGADTAVSSGLSPKLTSLAKNLALGVAVVTEVSAAAIIIVGAVAILGYELEQVGIAWEPVIENGEAVAAAIGIGTVALVAVGVACYALGSSGSKVASNVGIGALILLELGVAAGLFLVEIWAIGKALDEIGQAWQPVLDNGDTITSAITLGTVVLVGVGVAAAALGLATTGTGGVLPLAVGLGTLILAELGVAAGLFVIEIWAVGKALDEIGQAWKPVLEDGDTIKNAIALGTTLLVGIGVVAAALGVATVATVGLLPLAIGLGTAMLVELAAATVSFTESLVDVADELSLNLSPSLRRLNSKLPNLESDMSDFVDYITDFAEEISSYTSGMGSITWSSIVNGFLNIFAGDPIKDLANDVKKIGDSAIELNNKLETTNPELEKAIKLLTDYDSLMSKLKIITEKNGDIQLATEMFVNLKEVGKELVTGLTAGIEENVSSVSKSMSEMGTAMLDSLETSIEENKSEVRNSLANLFSGIQIKLPHFSISGAFNLEQKSVPEINVSWYASGGFPDYGEMFIAREDGPELVGRIGNRTAVANNEQIVEGIASANEGVVNAVYAMASMIVKAVENKDNNVYIGGKQLARELEPYSAEVTRNKGKSLVKRG